MPRDKPKGTGLSPGIEGVDGCVQVDRQRVLGIQGPRHGDQVLREVGVNLPRSSCIGIGQGIARNSLAAQTQAGHPSGRPGQARNDVRNDNPSPSGCSSVTIDSRALNCRSSKMSAMLFSGPIGTSLFHTMQGSSSSPRAPSIQASNSSRFSGFTM